MPIGAFQFPDESRLVAQRGRRDPLPHRTTQDRELVTIGGKPRCDLNIIFSIPGDQLLQPGICQDARAHASRMAVACESDHRHPHP